MNDQTNVANGSAESAAVSTKTTIRPNLDNYVRAKSGSGKRSHRIDDLVARTLDGKGLGEVVGGAKALGVDTGKWAHLNPGQQRMLIGNALRKMVNDEKEPLLASTLASIFGEPVAPYDAEAAAAAEQKAAEEKAAKLKAKEEAKAEREAKAAEKARLAAEKARLAAEKAEAGESDEGEKTEAKRGRRAAKPAAEEAGE